MKYRCEIDISFTDENDAVALLNLVQAIKGRVFKGTGNEEIWIEKKCRYHECFHDETPPKPCGNYINYDLTKVEKEDVKTKSGIKVDAGDLLKKGEVI